MWRCVKCMDSNSDTATKCAKCKADRPKFDPDETSLDGIVDLNRPVPISETSTVQCPTCGEMFKVERRSETASRVYHHRTENALCPSCSRAITPESLVKVSAAERESGQVTEVLLACPYCGKIVGVTSEAPAAKEKKSKEKEKDKD